MLIKKKKINKKAFTLIELLATIIIIAIVGVILIPVVTGILESSKKKAFVNSIYVSMASIKEDIAVADFKEFPVNGVDAKIDLTTEKNPFISGKFSLTSEKDIKAKKVTDGRYCATGHKEDLEVILGPCYLLDHTAPDATLYAGVITSNSIQVIMDASDLESDIVSYEYSKDNGSTFIKTTTNTFTFDKLVNNTSFNIVVKVTNENSLVTTKNITLKTLDIGMPTYTSNPSLTSWSKNKVVSIAYPEKRSNFIYEYSLDNARTWLSVPSGTRKDVLFNDNGNLTARVRDGFNVVSASTLTITTVDVDYPVVVNFVATNVTRSSITVQVSASQNHMGIAGYYYSKDNGASWTGLTTNTSYTFSGLSRGTNYPLKVRVLANNERITDSNTLNVRTLNEFTIYFNGNSGTTDYGSKNVLYGNSYGSLPGASRSNYIFLGWFTDPSGGSQVTSSTTVYLSGDQILYAHWRPNTVTVTFNGNGGTADYGSKNVLYSNSYGSLPGASRSNYIFLGWFTDPSGGSQVRSSTTVYLSGDQTLYAHWRLNTVTVTFDGNGGSSDSRTVTVGSAVGGLPSSSRSGYNFQGWFSGRGDGSQVTSDWIINRATTYYARWFYGGRYGAVTNNMNFTMSATVVQTGLNSIRLTVLMHNTNRSACGNGAIYYSCAGKYYSSNYSYAFGISGSCDYVYNGSWSVGLPSIDFTEIGMGSNVSCRAAFQSKNSYYFGNDISVDTGSFTMGY